ncbi:unnamed protein product [Sphenostylis stenocarpa]|uniref:Uncharacterized protein n=1 Tax=Sphenostylis stenocarpa TaxID=92480 RepID=A0AA86SGS5_9FABA|nr:unnamed protein product [Sphenostylis stenocarpa]
MKRFMRGESIFWGVVVSTCGTVIGEKESGRHWPSKTEIRSAAMDEKKQEVLFCGRFAFSVSGRVSEISEGVGFVVKCKVGLGDTDWEVSYLGNLLMGLIMDSGDGINLNATLHSH